MLTKGSTEVPGQNRVRSNCVELHHLSDKLGQISRSELLSVWVLAVKYRRGNLHTVSGVKERMFT